MNPAGAGSQQFRQEHLTIRFSGTNHPSSRRIIQKTICMSSAVLIPVYIVLGQPMIADSFRTGCAVVPAMDRHVEVHGLAYDILGGSVDGKDQRKHGCLRKGH